jgi:hypothetical protein
VITAASTADLAYNPSEDIPTDPFAGNSSANSVRSAGLTPSPGPNSTTDIEMTVDPGMAAPRRPVMDDDEPLEPPPPRYEEAIRKP